MRCLQMLWLCQQCVSCVLCFLNVAHVLNAEDLELGCRAPASKFNAEPKAQACMLSPIIWSWAAEHKDPDFMSGSCAHVFCLLSGGVGVPLYVVLALVIYDSFPFLSDFYERGTPPSSPHAPAIGHACMQSSVSAWAQRSRGLHTPLKHVGKHTFPRANDAFCTKRKEQSGIARGRTTAHASWPNFRRVG